MTRGTSDRSLRIRIRINPGDPGFDELASTTDIARGPAPGARSVLAKAWLIRGYTQEKQEQSAPPRLDQHPSALAPALATASEPVVENSDGQPAPPPASDDDIRVDMFDLN